MFRAVMGISSIPPKFMQAEKGESDGKREGMCLRAIIYVGSITIIFIVSWGFFVCRKAIDL